MKFDLHFVAKRDEARVVCWPMGKREGSVNQSTNLGDKEEEG